MLAAVLQSKVSLLAEGFDVWVLLKRLAFQIPEAEKESTLVRFKEEPRPPTLISSVKDSVIVKFFAKNTCRVEVICPAPDRTLQHMYFPKPAICCYLTSATKDRVRPVCCHLACCLVEPSVWSSLSCNVSCVTGHLEREQEDAR